MPNGQQPPVQNHPIGDPKRDDATRYVHDVGRLQLGPTWYPLCLSLPSMVRRIARYLATFGMTGVLIVGTVIIAPLVWPPGPDASLVLRNGQLMGEAVDFE